MGVLGILRVGQEPQGLALDGAGRRLFVANGLSGNVSVANLDTNQIVATLGLGGAAGPVGLDFDPARQRLYVAARFSDVLVAVDAPPGLTGEIVGAVLVGVSHQPVAAAVEVISGQVLVVGAGDSSLALVDGAAVTLTEIRRIGEGFQPWLVMVLPPGGFFVLGAWLLLFAWLKQRRERRILEQAGVAAHG